MALSVKKMSRFEEVGKNFEWQFPVIGLLGNLLTVILLRLAGYHPASRAFSYGTYALYREKALHKSCQVLVEHAQGVAK